MTLMTEQQDLSGLRIDHDRLKSGPERKFGKYYITAAIVLAGVIAFLWFSGIFSAAPEVETTTATMTYPSSANAVLTASGYVVAQQKASIASKATGRLVLLNVEEGDRVKKNQIIGQIEDQDVLASLAYVRANYELSKADLNDARQWYDRQRSLFASGSASQAELDAAQARLNRVNASIKSAQAAVDASEVALENTRIRAPFDGTVLTKNANVGEVVAPFAAGAGSRAAVVTIADMSSLEVEADVSESNIMRVKPDAPCEITLDAYPDKRYRGSVHKIVPTADRAKATVMTKIRFNDRDEHVLPEMSAKVTFLSKETEKTEAQSTPKLTVPSGSITKRNGGDVVLVVRDGQITETSVRTNGRIGDREIITEGISAGDQIVLHPDPSLKTGSKIKVKQ